MNAKKIIVWLLLVFVLALTYACLPTLRGIYSQKIAVWEEEAYIGKPLRDLQEMLRQRGARLIPVHESSVYPANHPGLSPNQKAFEFRKGKEYKWIIVGSAVNVGYVIVEERPGGAVVIEIIRASSMNSL